MDVGTVEAVFPQQRDEGLRTELAHEVGRNPVVRLRQSPLQRHVLAIAAAAGVAWSPRLPGHDVGLLHVGREVARREAVLHGERIEEGLDGGAYLAAAVDAHVVVEVDEVHAAHVCLHGSRLRRHAHEAATEERLVVFYRVERRHGGVNFAVVGEYAHLRRRVERLVYLVVRRSVFGHHPVSLALLHGPAQNVVELACGEVARIWSVGLAPVFLVEGRLQELHHVLVYGLFGVALHARVDGGEYLQSVGIDVVWLAVLLPVLVAPSAERVVLPVGRVLRVFCHVPRCVLASLRLLCHHVSAQEVAEVGGDAVLVVGYVEVESERLGGVGGIFRLAEIARLGHLLQHHVASLAAALGVAHGVEVGGVLAQSHQCGGLGHGEVLRLFAEIGV